LGLWLLVFLAVSVAIVARQRGALATAATLRGLKNERLALEARRAEFESRIREAASRPVLIPKVAGRLNLRVPSDSEMVWLTLPAVADSGS
jgi:hypothetical protein